MKKTILFMLLLMGSMAVMAVPARRVTRTFSTGGKPVTLTLRGDENLHYWQADDGTAYLLADNGNVTPINLTAARAAAKQRRSPQAMRAAASSPADMKRISEQNRVKYSGTRRGLVILANFKDKKFKISNPKETYQQVMSGVNYSGNGQYGSVRDYFYAQSYGQFDFELDVVGPVTLSQNMSYYGANDSQGNDVRPAHMAKEACQLANSEVDFSQYDWDGDGTVEQVFIIYAGYGEAQGADANTIWPHAWFIEGSGSSLTLDGKTISSYACGSELNGYYGTRMDGIGTVCHEFSHCFGLPDFYCTDYAHSQLTMSYWSLMDVGSYANDGYCPAAYTAYERWFCGWLEPTELDEGCYVENMTDINETGESYVVYNKGNRNEYYLLYNLQKTGWNTYSPGHGMMVLHVDYSASAWEDNTPNNLASHLRMTPICANNNRGESASALAGHPYPGTSGNNRLTDDSTPAAELFSTNANGRKFMGKPIEDIIEKDSKISFKFNGGKRPDAPQNLVEQGYENGKLTLAWQPVDDAHHYTLEYGIYDTGSLTTRVYVDERFDFGLTNDGNSDISSKLDSEFTTKGFTGSRLYKGKNGLKMGSSSANGYLITPSINFDSDEFVVTVVATPYNTTTPTIDFKTIDKDGNESSAIAQTDITQANQEVTATIKSQGVDRIRISATKRLYLASLTISNKTPSPYLAPTTLDDLTETQVTIDIDDNEPKSYYARICAVNQKGDASDWSPYTIIKIEKPDIDVCVAPNTHTPRLSVMRIDGITVKSPANKGIYVINGKKHVIM